MPRLRAVAALLAVAVVACDSADEPSLVNRQRDASGDVSAIGAELPCTPRQLSVGRDHACAVLIDGRAYCWGSNAGGALALPLDRPPSDEPVLVGERVAEIIAGHGATCARLLDGSVRCWGAVAGDQVLAPAPLEIGGNASQVVLGRARGCVLRADGVVLCWGPKGTVGSADGEAHATPVPLPAFPGRVASLAAAESGTCALQLDGKVLCWGELPPPYGATPGPIAVDAFGTDSVVVGLGRDELCALSSGGVVRCLSQPDAQLDHSIRLTVGARHACVLSDEGKLACFGDDSEGQLDGVSSGPATLAHPRRIARFEGRAWAGVTAGVHDTCALDDQLIVRCWGGQPVVDGGAPVDAALPEPVDATAPEPADADVPDAGDGGVPDGGAAPPPVEPEVPLSAPREPALPRRCP